MIKICSECGEAILPRRLKSVPNAQLCLGCKEREEANKARSVVRGGYMDQEAAMLLIEEPGYSGGDSVHDMYEKDKSRA